MEINKEQTGQKKQAKKVCFLSHMDARTYQGSLIVLMQTQKWCDKKAGAPWKLGQEVPAAGVRQVREGSKELSLPRTTLRPCRRNRREAKCQRPAVPLLPACCPLLHQYWVTHWVPCPRPSRSLIPISSPKPFFISAELTRIIFAHALLRY